jgi:hypothetical protein
LLTFFIGLLSNITNWIQEYLGRKKKAGIPPSFIRWGTAPRPKGGNIDDGFGMEDDTEETMLGVVDDDDDDDGLLPKNDDEIAGARK